MNFGGGGGGSGGGYDWNKREPLHCSADASRLWELRTLLGHYHPSVVQFATQVAKGEPVSYAGDPLQDHDEVGDEESALLSTQQQRQLGGLSLAV